MNRLTWSRLSPLQVGRYSEYFAKMEFTLFGFEVYTSEVDDRGVDFVARRERDRFYDVQVKSVRGYNYIFVPKEKTSEKDDHRYLAVVILHEGLEPAFYLIPMTAWQNPNALLVGRDYESGTSKPEWGLNLSATNQSLLDPYRFETVVGTLRK
jgi:hypothetical protein